MTPREKAKELLWKYLPILEGWKKEDSSQAKQCALIAINLAIDVEIGILGGKVYKSYWQEVKQEIEKL